MYDKEKGLFEAFVAKKMSRRELIKATGAAGLSASAAGFLLTQAQTKAMAADFDWMKHKGSKLKLLLNKHPYADAMIANIETFKSATGMDISWDIFPEDVYFDKVTAALSSGSTEYDAFMTGAYMTWTYGPAGWIADLNEFIKDPAKTNPSYNWEDMLPGLRASTSWNGVPGGELGSADAKQWCIPWGYELNNISYNKKMFDKAGVQPPKNLGEMVEISAKLTKDLGGPYGIGVRGSRSWASIHPGFLSGYANFGEKDFNVTDGKLKAAMNTAGSKAFHADWVKMIQESGPKNWSTYTWYQVGTDLGAGASAMMFDADILGYFMNGGDNKEKGNLGYAPFAANPNASAPTPNVWIWSLAMNNAGTQKDATWYFLQWATSVEHALFGARKMDFVNPVRASVWADEEFRKRIDTSYPGYLNQHDVSAPGAKIYFTAQPLFFDLTTLWSENLQKMILLLAGLRSLPKAPFEAAALDGVPRSFVFFRITLPMLMPYIITATLFRLLDSIQQFDIIYAMTQGGPGDKLLVFQVQAYLDFFQATNVGRSAALMIILWAITYALSHVFIKQWLKLRERAHGVA